MKFLDIYQYLAPLVLLPVGYYLWLQQFASHAFALLMLSMPVLFAYIIPGLGTNWLRLWEFNTRLRLGKFRPHHGFVFGAATGLLAWFCIADPPAAFNLLQFGRAGFILGSTLAFWNWLYDLYAIEAGFLVVYNRPYAEKSGAAAIAADYAPAIFGGFGFCYGIAIRFSQYYLLELGRWDYFWRLFISCNLATLAGPVLLFILWSYLKNGDSGLTSFRGD